MRILLDNGHGANTNGKHSPDKRVLEWKETRNIVDMLHRELEHRGYDVVKLVTEDKDISLRERCRRANQITKEAGGSKNALLVSIHLNAAGNGEEWKSAQGFSAHVAPNASAKSKHLAKLIWDEALLQELKGNRCVPNCGYITQNLAICRDTLCPAVLTENLFMDNQEDAETILSMGGRIRIVRAHLDAIIRYIEGV
jgi:N-acetylmuramoyl-L-alanine amidase